MGLILSNSQEVEADKKVTVFCLFDITQLCGLPSVGSGSWTFTFPMLAAFILFS
jgi:hypothetical protein